MLNALDAFLTTLKLQDALAYRDSPEPVMYVQDTLLGPADLPRHCTAACEETLLAILELNGIVTRLPL